MLPPSDLLGRFYGNDNSVSLMNVSLEKTRLENKTGHHLISKITGFLESYLHCEYILSKEIQLSKHGLNIYAFTDITARFDPEN